MSHSTTNSSQTLRSAAWQPSGRHSGPFTVMLYTRVQRLVTEHMQVPFSVTQGRYLLAQVLAYIQSLTAVP